MKHYIILTSGIYEMGGAEMFTANKSKYLKSDGWNVRVFFYRQFGQIRIPELLEYKGNCIPELLYSFIYIPSKRRKEILEQICYGITVGDEVIVESHIINLAYWGEMIAKQLKGKSIVNAMEETIAPMTDKEFRFIEFKLKRMEILNATEKSLHRYFTNRYNPTFAKYTHNYMRAFCSNVISEKDDSINLPTRGQNILSIGRLDKPYILPMFKEILWFVTQNPGNMYNLLVIGGSPNGTEENKIRSMFSNVDNVSLYLYGYMFPVPINLINIGDVCIAMANSILVSSEQGIPTIAIDINDLEPIGLFELTTHNRFRRENESVIPVSTWLEEVLNKRKYQKYSPKQVDADEEIVKVFSRQIEFLSISPCDKIYYDVEHIYPIHRYFLCQLKYRLHKYLSQNK